MFDSGPVPDEFNWLFGVLTAIGGLYALFQIIRWLWRRAFADRIAALQRTWALSRAESLADDFRAVVAVQEDTTRLISSGFLQLFRSLDTMYLCIILMILLMGLIITTRIMQIFEYTEQIYYTFKYFARMLLVVWVICSLFFVSQVGKARRRLNSFENFERFESSTTKRVTRLLRDAGRTEPEIDTFIADMLAGTKSDPKPE